MWRPLLPLKEGLQETLTLYRLGIVRYFKWSLGTMYIIEAANSAIAQRVQNVSRWSTGDQRTRCGAPALAETEGTRN